MAKTCKPKTYPVMTDAEIEAAIVKLTADRHRQFLRAYRESKRARAVMRQIENALYYRRRAPADGAAYRPADELLATIGIGP